MKVLRVIASMDPSSGGPCQGIRNSIPELEKLGIHNEVACLDEPNSSFIGKDSFLIHALGPTRTSWKYSDKLLPWLLINLSRFDAVIVHGLWLYHGYAVKKAIRILKRKNAIYHNHKIKVPKLFIMPHGMLDPYFQQARNRKLKAIRNWAYWKAVEGKVINHADGVFFTCEEELQLAKQPFRPYKPKKEMNIGYGIVTPPPYTTTMREAFLKKCPPLFESPYLLFLSRIHEKKGVDLLIKAYLAISEEKGKKGIAIPKLVIAGPGLETDYGQWIQQLVAGQAIGSHSVFFIGMLTGEAKWGAFYGCEVFVLPSHQENFGIAVVEALACSKPVLISNKVNIWQEIQSAEGGIIEEDTYEGTKKMLNGWLNMNSESRIKMEKKARNTYEQHFAIGPFAFRFFEGIKN